MVSDQDTASSQTKTQSRSSRERAFQCLAVSWGVAAFIITFGLVYCFSLAGFSWPRGTHVVVYMVSGTVVSMFWGKVTDQRILFRVGAASFIFVPLSFFLIVFAVNRPSFSLDWLLAWMLVCLSAVFTVFLVRLFMK